jgi:hypothetical protein
LEDHGKDIANAEARHQTDEDPYRYPRSAMDHDAQVEGENRQLAQAFCEHVHEVGDVQPLQALSDVSRLHAPHIATKAEAGGYDNRYIHSEGYEL